MSFPLAVLTPQESSEFCVRTRPTRMLLRPEPCGLMLTRAFLRSGSQGVPRKAEGCCTEASKCLPRTRGMDRGSECLLEFPAAVITPCRAQQSDRHHVEPFLMISDSGCRKWGWFVLWFHKLTS